jgi:hypothetical protein
MMEQVLRLPQYQGRAGLGLFGNHQAAVLIVWGLELLLTILVLTPLLGLFHASLQVERIQNLWHIFFPLTK